jgi:ribosomal protein S18 acetylase RimI-like enzyme
MTARPVSASTGTVSFDWRRSTEAGLIFRPVVDADLPFLSRLYAATRAEEFAMANLGVAGTAALLEMQFRIQHTQYQLNHPDAIRLVMTQAGEDIGRLYLARYPSEHSIIDIALLPEHCGKGLGATLIRDLQDEAAAAGKPVTLQVAKANPAMRLYRRLGFGVEADQGVYDLMRWHGPAA